MIEKKTLLKIKVLFALRRIPELLELAGLKKDIAFRQKLYHLQACIYRLDNYLESNWKLKKSDANLYWREIFLALKELGYDRKEAIDLCSDIQKYQEFEWSLRTTKPKNREKLYSNYRIKSCDVALMRKLIYQKSKKAIKKISLSDWRYFDLITEVNDDIQDLNEDCNIYNGNNLLISILQNGKSKSFKIYSKFINEIKDKAATKFKKNKKNPVNTWISDQVKITNKLLKSQIKKTKMSSLIRSKLAKKIFS